MAIGHRFLLLIHILYCAVITHGILLNINDGEICYVLCNKCNVSAVYINSQCECNFNDNDSKGVECIKRLQRDTQTVRLNVLSDNLTNEERSVRSTLKSKHLKVEDAKKVAQYFINGGVSAGHSHFIKAFNVDRDNTNSTTNPFSGVTRQSNTENKFHLPPNISPTSSNRYKSYDFPLHMVPEAAPMILGRNISDIKRYTSIGMMKPTFSYPTNRLYLPKPALDLIVHPYRKHVYQSPPHVLLQTAAPPSYILHNLIGYHYFPHYPLYHNPIEKNSYVSNTRPNNFG